MKKDIADIKDVELLVNSFYEKAKTDPLIGPFFTTIFSINWEKHLPVMYKFWNNAIFFTGGYSGNPLEVHRKIHRKARFSEQHFKRWNKLFAETIDEHFEGPKAALAKERAASIAIVMQMKILSDNQTNPL